MKGPGAAVGGMQWKVKSGQNAGKGLHGVET